MTVPDPPWKQKTRPCPFYSQGRCLFADSCNFLHDVKIKVKTSDITTSFGVVPGITLTQSPTESNTSFSSPTESIRRIRSPPRSPRLSSLLLALGDAIEPEEDGEGGIEEVVPSFESARALIAASGIFGQVSHRRNSPSIPSTGPPQAEDGVDGPQELPRAVQESYPIPEDEITLATSAVKEEAESPPHSSVRNSAITKRSSEGLLSPIDISLAAPAHWPLGQLDTVEREDSVDSGYAEWVGPTPLVLSPPKTPRSQRMSTLSLLSSPFGTPARILSPKFGPSQASTWPTSPLKSSQIDVQDESFSMDSSEDLDSPSVHAAKQLQSRRSTQSEHDPQSTIRAPDIPLVPSEQLSTIVDGGSHEEGVVPDDEVSIPPSPAMRPLPVDSAGQEERPTPDIRSVIPPAMSPEEPTAVDVISSREEQSILAYMSSPDAEMSLTFSAPAPALSPVLAHAHSPALAPVLAPVPDATPFPESESIAYADDGAGPVSAKASILRTIISPPPSEGHDTSIPSKTFNRDAAGSSGTSHPVSPTISLRSLHQSPSPISPSSISSSPQSRPGTGQASASGSRRESRSSHKVPFGFRHSSSVRSRDSSVSSRHTSTSRSSTRHRPPALTNIHSSLISEFADTPTPSEPSSTFTKLKPLRLSLRLNTSGSVSSSTGVTPALTSAPSYPSTISASSGYPIAHNPLLSSPQSSIIPTHNRNTLIIDQRQSMFKDSFRSAPLSAPLTSSFSWKKPSLLPPKSSSVHDFALPVSRPESRLSQSFIPVTEDEDVEESPAQVAALEDPQQQMNEDSDSDMDEEDLELDAEATIRVAEMVHLNAPRPPSPASIAYEEPLHAIATPKPTLLFAIASDNVDEVRKVLENGDSGPNDEVGPQSALAFAVTAQQLKNRTEIVKVLLAHGADPSSLKNSGRTSRTSVRSADTDPSRVRAADSILVGADAATRYYISRAEAPQMRRASALIHRSFFRPLTKVRYDMVGQDRALEQLFRVLSMPTMAPIVVLLCGPSGHGKSLLARKFGSLLDVPTHTVNMTTLRSTHDIWKSYSMNPYEPPSTCTLSDFLIENEGKRCVVVLDEIEKTENEKVLSSLLMPWELGRCSIEAGHRHIDVSRVIWLGTSNVGHDLVFEHDEARVNREEPMSREEYVDLIGLLRPRVSDRLGPSVLSRVTTVLPFIPFTVVEQKAIATEALNALAGEDAQTLPSATVDRLIGRALQNYIQAEGARSIYRAVSTELLDVL